VRRHRLLVNAWIGLGLMAALGARAQDDLEFDGGVMASISLNLGLQENNLDLRLSLFGVANYKSTAAEAGINLTGNLFLEKFGISESGRNAVIEGFGLFGFGDNTNLLGMKAGRYSDVIAYDPNGQGGFYGIGVGVAQHLISGTLSKFATRQGSLLLRGSNGRGSVAINIYNDPKVGFFHGSGTDKGPTGGVVVTYSRLADDRDALDVFTFGLDVFTPEPDYSRSPRNPKNSDHGSRVVAYTTEPYGDVFHANTYVGYQRQQDGWAGQLLLGLDNPRFGAKIQNVFHDNFALYPRFPWPTEKRSRLYLQARGTLHQFKANEFNNLWTDEE
ncbi:MAG: hypothetical protein AAGB22_13545, partial [Bacteroidota bacterium]